MLKHQSPQSYQITHDLLTLSEAAGYAGYSTGYVSALTRDGKLPFVKRGRRKYIHRADLDNLFSNGDTGEASHGEAERLSAVVADITARASDPTPECKANLRDLLS